MDKSKLIQIVERLRRPGVMSPVGTRREKSCSRDLKAYFDRVHGQVMALHIERQVGQASQERVLGMLDQRVERIVARHRPLLVHTLVINLYEAWMEAWKQDILKEAGEDKDLEDRLRQAANPAFDYAKKKNMGDVAGDVIDKLGPSGQAAADWAGTYSSTLATAIDDTTRKKIRELVTKGIEQQSGPDALARWIRSGLDDISAYRSKLIGQTEMNNAFSESALMKMKSLSYQYKELVPSPDACEVCTDIADDGPVRVDDLFKSLFMRTPIHPGCRCAIVASRGPQEEE